MLPSLSWKPTATTVPSLRAVTPESELSVLPGFGLLMIVQLVPFRCSISVPVPSVHVLNVPTAKMSLAELAVIPFSKLLKPGSGLETMLQLGRLSRCPPRPKRCSTRRPSHHGDYLR
jgi:hypothetical protein